MDAPKNEQHENLIKQLLISTAEIISCLKNCKWNFKGWIVYPDYQNVKFELVYEDKITEDKYCINGYCNILKGFKLTNSTFAFCVTNKDDFPYINYNAQVNPYNKTIFEKIERILNDILKTNRSYKYFCEDYERYMKQDPISYIKDIIKNQLIEMEDESFDEGQGMLYHFTGEFGEDLLEIVVDDRDYSDEEERDQMDGMDYLRVDISERFQFEICEYNSKIIRSLLHQDPKVIHIDDFLVRSNMMYCLNRKHHLQRIKARVCIDTGKSIQEIEVEASYCEECNQYYISEVEYEKLCKKGRVCCRVITIEEYIKITETGVHTWAEKSLLRSYGYTVNAHDNLSENERHRILSFVIDNKIMEEHKIINFLEWLIHRNTGKNFYTARLKWNKDIEYIQNRESVKRVVKVKDIYRRKIQMI